MTVFKHETVFDTAGRTMEFKIHNRLSIVVDFANYEIIIFKDGNVIDRTNFMGEPFTITDLEMVLMQAHKSCEKLSKV
ncbi:MAG: hypothetical protein PHU69_14775 [Fermentimonas sp.]|nr:hypothetical protein [Fermentimonas sp.]